MHQATDKNRSARTLTYKQLKHEFDVASLLFSGRETESNWESRQAFFENIKVYLSSDNAKTHKKELLDKIHEVIPSIYNTIKSIRTTLIEEALSLVEAIGTYVGDSINMHTNEAILRFLMNESSVTKKAIASRAFEATNNYLTKTRFRPKVLTFLCTRAQDKNPQLREFALGYIKTVLSVHGPANKLRLIEHADLTRAITNSLQKGLVDAIPTVRSACKETYYVFEEHWPTAAYEFASKLDIAIQRRLGVNTVQSSSTTSKPAKPLLHHTSKSTASAIKKPASSISIGRAARSNIKAAMQKPSNTAFSITSKSHTHGFNLSNYRQVTVKPAQTSSHAAMSCIEANTILNTTPTMKSDNVVSTTPSTKSDIVKNTTPSAKSDTMISTAPNTTSILEPSANTANDPQEVSLPAKDLPATYSQTLSPNSYSQESSSSNSSQELSSQPTEPSSIAAENLPHPVKIPFRRGSRVMPSPTSSSSNEGSKSPLHLIKRASVGAVNKAMSPHSFSQAAKLLKKYRSVMSPISNTEIPARSSSVYNKASPVASVKQPRQLDHAAQHRLGLLPAESALKSQTPHTTASTIMPSPTPSTSNKSPTATSITKSPRPKLRKSVSLSKKYDHITSRYKNIPAHRK